MIKNYMIAVFSLLLLNVTAINVMAVDNIYATDDEVSIEHSGVKLKPSKMAENLENAMQKAMQKNNENVEKKKMERPPKPQSFKDLRWF